MSASSTEPPCSELDVFVAYLKQSFIEPLAQLAENTHAIEELPYVPFAYTTDYSRAEIRASPLLYSLHQFLIMETNAGCISRQEAVRGTRRFFVLFYHCMLLRRLGLDDSTFVA